MRTNRLSAVISHLALLLMLLCVALPASAFTLKEQMLIDSYEKAIKTAAEHALTEMRPSAEYLGSKIQRIRESEALDGGTIKARVATAWKFPLLDDRYQTVIDIWITPDDKAIYLTRYKLHSDNNRVPILLSTDERVQVLLQTLGMMEVESSQDDF
ncbi:hypothetical protein SAMN02745704_02524 [Paucidesulfovibrio gracilis DSM 16080]|uniref:DUF302 domain-containing protein n=1 Tax=Paucidesulfovibrio gracilis DSM 16080 TaxID=1121449 RepID=A0A1T4XWT1_9BACT|nr:hypothetical protein [Paucidesulfovibrio gracilis]SKA93863.1 hypothetical protein SAMN02745704_02524 [Paucidesulfovibrio gracilis DSM 16080]